MPPKIKSEVVYKGPGKAPQDYFKRFMPAFKKWAILEANNVVKEASEWMAQEARNVLDTQRYNWKPLKDYYKKRKISHGLDERILIATGLYRDSIKAWKYGGNYYFGVRKGVKTEDGVPLWKIMKIHEFGTKTIPARPLWRPILAKAVKRFPEFAKQYHKAVRKQMKPYYGYRTARRSK